MTRRLDLPALLLGIAAALVGGAAVAGYALSLPALLRLTPETAPVVFAGGLALTLGGIALAAAALAPTPASRRVACIGGAAVALLGLAGITERALGMDLGIDLPALHIALGIEGPAPGRMMPAGAISFTILGACLLALQVAEGRRTAIALIAGSITCGVLGAMALTAYALNVEFLRHWPTDTPRPLNGALALVFLGAGLCSAVLHRAKLTPSAVQESQSIQLTSVWMLSVIAVVAGISTFALAQYEYQDAVRADLARTSRDRRAFLDRAIQEHLQHVTLGAHAALAVSSAPDAHPHEPRVLHDRLQGSANLLTRNGFSAWGFHIDGTTTSSGRFIENPQAAITLSGAYRTDLLLKDGGYFLRTRMPIRDRDRDVGYALAEAPFPELTRLELEADSWGETGAMVLCAAVEREADCLPSRNNPDAARMPSEVTGRALPIRLALDGEVGIDEALDLRRRRVLAAYGPVGFTGLGMVLQIDAAEVNAPLGRRFGSAVVLLAALVAAGVSLLRRRLVPLTNALVDAREEAKRVAAQFKAAAESSLDAYFLMDAVRDRRQDIVDFCIRYVNASGAVLTARPCEALVAKTLREVLPADQARYFITRYARVVSTGQALSEELRMPAGDASAVSWVAHQAVKLGEGVSITARDITQLKNVELRLRSKAENDPLTGLPNRALFFDRLGRALTKARQSTRGVAVLFLDIDRFKTVNDSYGHAAGDAVLVEFAGRLRKLVRETDTIARLGGDEFAILLAELDTIAQAERVAAEIVSAIEVPFMLGTLCLDLGTSIGVGFSSTGFDTPEALVGRADRKLYQAKTAGRGRFASGGDKRAA